MTVVPLVVGLAGHGAAAPVMSLFAAVVANYNLVGSGADSTDIPMPRPAISVSLSLLRDKSSR